MDETSGRVDVWFYVRICRRIRSRCAYRSQSSFRRSLHTRYGLNPRYFFFLRSPCPPPSQKYRSRRRPTESYRVVYDRKRQSITGSGETLRAVFRFGLYVSTTVGTHVHAKRVTRMQNSECVTLVHTITRRVSTLFVCVCP